MNTHIGLNIKDLYLAIPGYEIAQINLIQDIEYSNGIPVISFHKKLIPVVYIAGSLDQVIPGGEHNDGQYVVTLATLNRDMTPNARLALQLNSVSKIQVAAQGVVPDAMKKNSSPILGWFEDQSKSRGFTTNTTSIETFINYSSRLTQNEYDHTMAS